MPAQKPGKSSRKTPKVGQKNQLFHLLKPFFLFSAVFIIFPLVLLTILLVRMFTETNDPKDWPPFFSFYTSEACYKREGTTLGCSSGTRAYAFDDQAQLTALQLMEKLEMTMVRHHDNQDEVIGPMDYTEWKCKTFSYHGIPSVMADIDTFVPKRGDVLHCWPTTPLEENVRPVSMLRQRVHAN
jgi:hypothetical protein